MASAGWGVGAASCLLTPLDRSAAVALLESQDLSFDKKQANNGNNLIKQTR
jgi:hypothetical protein